MTREPRRYLLHNIKSLSSALSTILLSSILLLKECQGSFVPTSSSFKLSAPRHFRQKRAGCSSSFRNAQNQQQKNFLRTSTSNLYQLTKLRAKNDGASNDKNDKKCHIDHVEKIYVISDLHTDNIQNLEWLSQHCSTSSTNIPGPNDALIIAGDISHELSTLNTTLSIITEKLQCHCFFVFGNHEAWIGGKEMNGLGITTSLEKIERVKDVCNDLGVYTDCELVGGGMTCPAWIVPIEGWYDGSLAIPETSELCSDFHRWPWVDFMRCVWPKENKPSGKKEDGKIPVGLNEYMLNWNVPAIEKIRSSYIDMKDNIQKNNEEKSTEASSYSLPGLITFSHFLPNQQCLPDWKDLNSDIFLKDEWLDHGAAGTSAKFAKVAGSFYLDEQIRSILPTFLQKKKESINAVSHLHVFGHSHRPKDFTYEGIRYIHNPLGKPKERDMHMVSHDVHFQLVWDTTSGENYGEEIIRYWEQKGGGLEALQQRIKKRRKKRKAAVRQIMEAMRKDNVESVVGNGRKQE